MQRTNLKFLLKVGIGILFVLVIIGYTYSKSRNLIIGPRITIESPLDGSSAATSTIEINGKAINITAISMNDRPIFVDEMGIFKEYILLGEGYNIIKITAKDKFGRQDEKLLHIVYEPHI